MFKNILTTLIHDNGETKSSIYNCTKSNPNEDVNRISNRSIQSESESKSLGGQGKKFTPHLISLISILD